jgi:hypothetical protein
MQVMYCFEDLFKRNIAVQSDFKFDGQFNHYNLFKLLNCLHVLPWEIEIPHSS